jgi:hypothetical protein
MRLRTRRASTAARGGTFALLARLALASAALAARGASDFVQDAPPPAPSPAAPAAAPRVAKPSDAKPPEAKSPGAARALAPYEPRYHDLAEVRALVDAWVAAEPAPGCPKAERLELPLTQAGLSVPALQWGGPGAAALSERPTIFLIGGLDGVSLSGSEAVLSVTSTLLSDVAALPAGVTFTAIPWASPEALAATLSGKSRDGRNSAPVDDDGDGRVDEDGPDDLDGDGMILDMLIEDPAGPWTRALDPRFLVPARADDAPRYVLTLEGKDDDHDGRFNEDPIGGIDLDLDFPLGFAFQSPSRRDRPLPLQDPTSRALADLLLARRSACVFLFQGNHGLLARPGGTRRVAWPKDADAAVFDNLARLFAHATGRSQSDSVPLCDARGAERAGAALDWIYAVPGAVCCEVAAWGPSVEKTSDAKGVAVADALFENGATGERTSGPPPVSAVDRAWARWLDNTRGGIGFVDWHPVDLGDGRRGLVGGFEPFSRLNPPVKSLPASQAGLAAFVERAARALPALDLRFDEMRRDGEVCTLRVRVENKGELPTGLWTTGRWQSTTGTNAGVVLELALPQGARMLAGEPRVELGELCAGGASRTIAWVVLAAPGSTLKLELSAPWTIPTQREVKP